MMALIAPIPITSSVCEGIAERLRKGRCIGRRRSHRQARCGLAGTMLMARATRPDRKKVDFWKHTSSALSTSPFAATTSSTQSCMASKPGGWTPRCSKSFRQPPAGSISGSGAANHIAYWQRHVDGEARNPQYSVLELRLSMASKKVWGIVWVGVFEQDKIRSQNNALGDVLVEPRRIELLTSAVRLQRSPI